MFLIQNLDGEEEQLVCYIDWFETSTQRLLSEGLGDALPWFYKFIYMDMMNRLSLEHENDNQLKKLLDLDSSKIIFDIIWSYIKGDIFVASY